jgi:hypothetical protein
MRRSFEYSGALHRTQPLRYEESRGILFPRMATNIEVEKNNNESTANLIRRFTKRVQGAGIIPRIRSTRYHKRVKSSNVGRTAKLLKLGRKEKYDTLFKLGKIQERPQRRRR